MPDTILASIIGGSFGIGSAILGVFIGWLLNKQTIANTVKRQEIAKAAIIAFTPYLDKTGVKRIDKAWFDYRWPNGIKENTEEEIKYEFPLGDYVSISEPKRTALEKIEALLSISSHII